MSPFIESPEDVETIEREVIRLAPVIDPDCGKTEEDLETAPTLDDMEDEDPQEDTVSPFRTMSNRISREDDFSNLEDN
jgi:hypothetical protein